MKKRHLIAGLATLAGVGLAYKLSRRPRDVEWTRYARRLHHPEHSWFAMIDGIRVHYQDFGDENAPPIVMIHGFIASNFVWSDVVKPIATKGFRVIAPDLIGYGFSDKPRRFEYTIDAQARTIIRLLDTLGIEKATLVGSSYGGAIAATIALDHPDRVERLVLVDAVINDGTKNQALLRLGASPVLGDMLSPLILDTEPVMRWRMRQFYAPCNQSIFDAERMESHYRPLRAANTHRAIIKTLRHWQADRIEREAHHIKQPTLVIWGEHDLETPLKNGEKLHHLITDSRLIVFRNCGHLPQEEFPKEFAELIVDFCDEQKHNEMIEHVKKQLSAKAKVGRKKKSPQATRINTK
jgi:pimeloyl-ACP methyl ester carboxylesterase